VSSQNMEMKTNQIFIVSIEGDWQFVDSSDDNIF
jgi:hypothetical protein